MTYAPKRADALEPGDIVSGVAGPLLVEEAWEMNDGTVDVVYAGGITETYDAGYVLATTPDP
jgi:hypothetical protein